MARGVGGGGRLIEGRLLFEEIRYSEFPSGTFRVPICNSEFFPGSSLHTYHFIYYLNTVFVVKLILVTNTVKRDKNKLG